MLLKSHCEVEWVSCAFIVFDVCFNFVSRERSKKKRAEKGLLFLSHHNISFCILRLVSILTLYNGNLYNKLLKNNAKLRNCSQILKKLYTYNIVSRGELFRKPIFYFSLL